MHAALLKALVALIPVCIILAGSLVLFIRTKTGISALQLLGATCLVIVVLTHVCEAWHFLSWMRWGEEGSVGHYLDLASAVLGLTLFPLGFLLQTLKYAGRR